MNLHKKLNVLKQALLKEKFGNWQLLSSHTRPLSYKDRDLKSKRSDKFKYIEPQSKEL